jgi:hypothetical protein
MKEHPLSLLREELAVADAKLGYWRRITMATIAFSVLCLSTAVAAVSIGGAYAQELRAYRQRCINHDSANIIADLSLTLVKVNDACFELHERNVKNLEESFPDAFHTEEGMRLRYMYEVADVRKEEMPILPAGKGGGGVLPGEEPK